MNNNKIFLKVFSSEVFSTMFFPSVLTLPFLGAGLFSLLFLFLGPGPGFRYYESLSLDPPLHQEERQNARERARSWRTISAIQYSCSSIMSGASSVFPRHGRQSCTIVHNPKLSQSGYIFIHLHTSPGLRLGFSRLEITDSLIASDAKRSYLPDYANHLSPGCWGVGTCDPCFSCTFCVVLLLIVPGYSKSHTAVNAGYLGLGWET